MIHPRRSAKSGRATIPGYVTYDAMASYRVDRRLTLQLNGYNLTNKFYYGQAYYSSPVENHVVPGAGRTGLLTVSFAY